MLSANADLVIVVLKIGTTENFRNQGLDIKLKMYKTGDFEFYHVKNDIWLIETSIPPEFIDSANIMINPKPY